MKFFKPNVLILILFLMAVQGSVASTARAQTNGEIVASIGFDPKIHGYGINNFGINPDVGVELTEDDLI